MSDDTGYPCCPHRMSCEANICWSVRIKDNHERPCKRAGCRGASPVGPTKEGKQ